LKLVKHLGYDTDRPVKDDTVTVHYVARLESGGSQYDSTRERGRPFKFVLGKDEVIKGWDVGIPTMCRGEIAVLRCQPEYAYAGAGSPPAIPPYATLVFEVELLDFVGLDVSDNNNGLLFKSRLVKGEEFGSPSEGSQCDIHIIGKYKGHIFEDRDVSFVLGEGCEAGLVDGVELGLRRLTRGETSRLRVMASLAYGKEGCPEHCIPPNTYVDYEITLKDFVKGKEFWDLDTQEKIEFSMLAKVKGNEYFKMGKFKAARFHYGRIVEYLQYSDTLEGDDLVQRNSLILAAHLNLALCHIKLGNPEAAKQSASKALEVDGKNEKALFRRGLANEGLQEYELAIADFKAVLDIDRENRAAKQQLTVTCNRIKEQHEKERQTYAGMFDKLVKVNFQEKATEKGSMPETVTPLSEKCNQGNGGTGDALSTDNLATAENGSIQDNGVFVTKQDPATESAAAAVDTSESVGVVTTTTMA
jgi:FKBP-type peptidyl-prolyl cis-trans isomerase